MKELGFNNVEEAEDGVDALNSCRQAVMDLLSPTGTCPTWMLGVAENDSCGWRDVSIASVMVTAEAKKENIIAAAQAGASAMW